VTCYNPESRTESDVSKKWYNFFVVTDDQAGAIGAPAPTGSPAASADPVVPVRAIDVAGAEPTAPAVADVSADGVDLSQVYTSAQIGQPPHGYTVLKVAEMLRSEHIASLPAEVKRKSVMVALDAAGVKVEEIVEDAVRRDRALDTYERVLQKHVEDVRASLEAENARIETEIQQHVAEMRARIDANAQTLAAETRELEQWRARKHQEEATIAEAVGYFVSENPITVTARTGAAGPKGASDVR
jgi:Asp-tRNA(Asn)/Glu-tRNA(Gln) amidotransferase A subunit family amidase